jgi:hypothetical protein
VTLLDRLALLDRYKAVDGIGRNILEQRIFDLCAWLEKDIRDREALEDNLTATQTRCTELLEETRRLRGVSGPRDLSRGLNGPAGPSARDPFDPLVGTAADAE